MTTTYKIHTVGRNGTGSYPPQHYQIHAYLMAVQHIGPICTEQGRPFRFATWEDALFHLQNMQPDV